MLYVGLTEDHRESATMFANVVGAQVISQLESSNSSSESITDKKSGSCCPKLRPLSNLCFIGELENLKESHFTASSGQRSSFAAAEVSLNGHEVSGL